MTAKTNQEPLVTAQFGPRPAAYVASHVHAQGEGLQSLVGPVRGLNDARILDLGCGGGHVGFHVAPEVACIAGIGRSLRLYSHRFPAHRQSDHHRHGEQHQRQLDDDSGDDRDRQRLQHLVARAADRHAQRQQARIIASVLIVIGRNRLSAASYSASRGGMAFSSAWYSETRKIAISVAMPMIITMPIIAVILSSTPVSHRPMKTALVEISEADDDDDRDREALDRGTAAARPRRRPRRRQR